MEKTYTLQFLGKEYQLVLTKNTYVNNDRTYLGFVDANDGEPFCDLSENHPEISDKQIYGRLPGHEAIILDNDFLSCFESPREAKIWLSDNCKDFVVITGDIDGRDCIYIERDTDHGKE